MTEQVIAAIELESLAAGGPQTLAALKIETLSQQAETQHVGAAKLEALLQSALMHNVRVLKLETLLNDTPLVILPPKPPIANQYRPVDIPCQPAPGSRFRKFWTTQPDACPPEQGQCTSTDPGNTIPCAQPGLTLIPSYDPAWQQLAPASDGGGALPECGPSIVGATIANNDYVRGLALNILGTNGAQAKTICGQIPGQRLGYWFDDITGESSGSAVRYVPTDGYTVNQQVQFIQLQANADMQKLVKYGVANSVTVAAKYVGNSSVQLIISIYGSDDTMTVVNSTVTKIANSWVWNT